MVYYDNKIEYIYIYYTYLHVNILENNLQVNI